MLLRGLLCRVPLRDQFHLPRGKPAAVAPFRTPPVSCCAPFLNFPPCPRLTTASSSACRTWNWRCRWLAVALRLGSGILLKVGIVETGTHVLQTFETAPSCALSFPGPHAGRFPAPVTCLVPPGPDTQLLFSQICDPTRWLISLPRTFPCRAPIVPSLPHTLGSPNPSSQQRSRDADVRVSSPPHHVSDSVWPTEGRDEALMLTKVSSSQSLHLPRTRRQPRSNQANRPSTSSTSYNARAFCLTARRETPNTKKPGA
ncbi:hypothetical protein QBC34DRAFT_149962 [Podospora aff. communis PSN243]|uniref:Uncharacterized protein n=1 Tax=Podospora aff. communis PSN243 TaxID=3040156 RepID=A0AAV9GE49_9PEZI|nr:hypothetical protein QBC34DRAFT_149962 [Podospora aff. communis PSN243]